MVKTGTGFATIEGSKIRVELVDVVDSKVERVALVDLHVGTLSVSILLQTMYLVHSRGLLEKLSSKCVLDERVVADVLEDVLVEAGAAPRGMCRDTSHRGYHNEEKGESRHRRCRGYNKGN